MGARANFALPQVRGERLVRPDAEGVWEAEREARGNVRDQDPRGARLLAPKRRRALRLEGGEYPHDEEREREALGLWRLAQLAQGGEGS